MIALINLSMRNAAGKSERSLEEGESNELLFFLAQFL